MKMLQSLHEFVKSWVRKQCHSWPYIVPYRKKGSVLQRNLKGTATNLMTLFLIQMVLYQEVFKLYSRTITRTIRAIFMSSFWFGYAVAKQFHTFRVAMTANPCRLYTGGWHYAVEREASSPAHRVVWILQRFQWFVWISFRDFTWGRFMQTSNRITCCAFGAKDIYSLLIQLQMPLPADISICSIVVCVRLTSNGIHKNA